MSTDLVVRDTTDGCIGVYDSDLRMPRYRIVQPIAPGEYEPGMLASNLGDERESIHVVPLIIKRGQVLWAPQGEGDGTPLCRSLDGLRPDPTIEHPISDECAVIVDGRRIEHTCESAQWSGDKLHRKPPACSQTWDCVFCDVSTQGCFAMSFARTGLPCVTALLSQKAALGCALWEMSATLQPDKAAGKVAYFIPRFTGIARMTADVAAPYAVMFRQLMALT